MNENREVTMNPFAPTQLLIRNAWYAAGLSSEFPTLQLQQRVIAERTIVLWRDAREQIVAFDDRCCHKRMPLSVGRFVEDGLLECAYHGLCFDSEGRCVRIPSQPELPIPKRARLNPFPVIEQHGVVWVWPGDAQRVGNMLPPATPELLDPDWEHVHGMLTIRANSVLTIENLLDASHFYPLHGDNIGKPEDSSIPLKVEEGETDGSRFVRAVREVDAAVQTADFADLLGYEVADSYSSQTMMGPGLVVADRTLWPAGAKGDPKTARKLLNLHMLTPIDRRSHVYRWVVNMPKGQMSGRYRGVRAIDRASDIFKGTFAQDLWALEKQQAASEQPEGGFEELFVRADAALVKARRVLQELQRLEA
jgi:nitrite reductase/ring-hydroxylating ferredoxin subunit